MQHFYKLKYQTDLIISHCDIGELGLKNTLTKYCIYYKENKGEGKRK